MSDSFSIPVSEPTSDRRRVTEIIAVLITASGKFIFMDWLDQKLPFILIAILAWTSYVLIRARQQKSVLKNWGFRTDNFFEALKKVMPFALLAIVSCMSIGLWNGTLNISWHIIPILILYPIWGTVQQFLLIALVTGNAFDMEQKRLGSQMILFLSSLLFAIIHFPDRWLMIATFLLALFYGWVYKKVRNVYVLGLFHGWLGAIVFYTIVDRDPFLEVFGTLL